MSDEIVELEAEYSRLRCAAAKAQWPADAVRASDEVAARLRALYTAGGRDLRPLDEWMQTLDASLHGYILSA